VEAERREVTDKEGDDIARPGHRFKAPMGLQPWAKPSRFLSAPGRGRSRREREAATSA
jgi:hypothetical protein